MPRDEHDDPLGLRSAPQRVEQITVGVVVTAAVVPQVHDDGAQSLRLRRFGHPASDGRRRHERLVVADVEDALAGERGRPDLLVATGDVRRYGGGDSLRQQRMLQITDSAAVLRNGERSQAGGEPVASALERERHRTEIGHETEPVQYLRRVEVGRNPKHQRRVVVVRNERTDGRDHVLDRMACDRDDSRPQEIRPTGLPDDVRTVGERVHPDRIRMEETTVRGIEREDSRMTVARLRASHRAASIPPATGRRRVSPRVRRDPRRQHRSATARDRGRGSDGRRADAAQRVGRRPFEQRSEQRKEQGGKQDRDHRDNSFKAWSIQSRRHGMSASPYRSVK